VIGICVVYMAGTPEQFGLLERSIAELQRMTAGPYRIYGIVPGNDPAVQRRLKRHPVTIVTGPSERYTIMHEEHSRLLDLLVDRAVADGCSHIATFDMDSWPLLRGWDTAYPALLTEAAPVVAILRNELGDNFPFAAFTLFPATFWQPGNSSFLVNLRGPSDPDAAPLASRPETGSGILAQLARAGQGLHRLERSNVWDIHLIFGAVYDNTIYHLGAGSRRPKTKFDAQIYRTEGDPVRMRFADEMNAAQSGFAIDQTLARYEDFIHALIGSAPAYLPILTPTAPFPACFERTPPEQRAVWPGMPPPLDAGPPAAPVAVAPAPLARRLKQALRVLRG
jgi:hypothetical protein